MSISHPTSPRDGPVLPKIERTNVAVHSEILGGSRTRNLKQWATQSKESPPPEALQTLNSQESLHAVNISVRTNPDISPKVSQTSPRKRED